jgi:hypothetical protein
VKVEESDSSEKSKESHRVDEEERKKRQMAIRFGGFKKSEDEEGESRRNKNVWYEMYSPMINIKELQEVSKQLDREARSIEGTQKN